MKRNRHSIYRNCLMTMWAVCALNTFAQDFPTDGDPWVGNGPGSVPSWAGDTIISRGPIGGHPNHSPMLSLTICAIYCNNYIIITTNNALTFSFAIRDEEQSPILRGQGTATATPPAIIDVTTLPPGRYTLLLYINNECLEGEFEKEF